MEEKLSNQFSHSFYSSKLPKAAAIIFTTVSINSLLRSFNLFALAAQSSEFTKDKRNLEENQQINPLINFAERSRLPINGMPTDIKLYGQYAMLATEEAGLLVADITDTRNPILVSRYQTIFSVNSTGYPIHQIVIDGNYAYLAEGIGGLRILDISRPSNLSTVGTYYTGWPVVKLSILDNKAWLIGGSTGTNFAIVDVSKPQEVARSFINGADYDTPGNACFINDLVYLSCDKGLCIVNVSNPISPYLQGSVNISVSTIFQHGLALYVCKPFRVLNITDPSMPRLVMTTGSSSCPTVISGTMLFSDNNNNLVTLFNISNPFNPQIKSNYYVGSSNYIRKINPINNQYLYVDISRNVQIVNISNPNSPQLVSSFNPNNYCNATSQTYDYLINENFIYFFRNCFQIFNISDPGNPQLLIQYTNSPYVGIYDFEIDANIAYITNDKGLYVIDISNPLNLNVIGNYSGPIGTSTRIIVDNNITYIIGSTGTEVMNATNPRNIQLLNHFDDILYAHNNNIFINKELVVINGNFPEKNQMRKLSYQSGSQITDISSTSNGIFTLYSGLGLTWLQLLSISTKPIFWQNSLSTSSNFLSKIIRSISIDSRSYVYLHNNEGFQIVNAMNSSNIQFLGYYPFPNITQLDFVDDVLIAVYKNDISSGIEVVNISNPTSPQRINGYLFSDSLLDINVENYFAYSSTYDGRLIILNMSNMQLIGNFSLSVQAMIGTVTNNTVYMIGSGLQIINVNVPANIRSLGNYILVESGLQNITSMAIYQNFALLSIKTSISTGNSYKIQLIDIHNPGNPLFIKNYNFIFRDPIHVKITNHTLYVVHGIYLQLFDIRDPIKPNYLGSFSAGCIACFYCGACTSIKLSMITDQNRIYYLDDDSIVYVINQASQAPLWDSRLTIQPTPYKMAVTANFNYIIDGKETLHVIDWRDPLNLTETITNYQLTNHAEGMIVYEDFIYVAEGLQGIEIIDVYQPFSPQFTMQLTNNLTDVRALTFNKSQLFIADASNEFIIYEIQGQLLLVNHQFIVNPGMNFTVTSDQLSARDTNVGAKPLQLTFTISNPKNGYFAWTRQPNVNISRFTQQEVITGNVSYFNTNTVEPPSFQITVSDGIITTQPQAAIIIFNANLPPVIINNRLTINEGQTVTLTVNDLDATDVNPLRTLTFITNNIRYGLFQFKNASNVFITTFTKNDILNGTVQFVSTAEEVNIPGYQVIVSNGVLSSMPSTANISYNAAPQLIANQLTIAQGATIQLSSNDLSAIDVDSDNATLIFIISNVQFGSFNLLNFTQQILWNGQVQFTQDGSSQAPIYYVNVSDGRIQVGPQKAITNLSDNLIPITAGATAAGATLLVAAVGIGFWFRKRKQDYNTRKQHQFADYIRETLKLKGIDNFHSEKGRRYVSIIQKLTQDFSNQGLDLRQRTDNELKSIAKDVAKAARNKITYSTNCLGYSDITIDEIDQKISAIVQEVLRLHAGTDKSELPMSSL